MRPPTLSTLLVLGALVCAALAHTHANTGPAPSATVLQHVLVGGDDERVVVHLVGSSEISGVLEMAKDPPVRIFIDLAGVVPQVQRVIPVARGAVHQVRVGLNRARPPVTRVVLDLAAGGSYRLEHGNTTRELQITVRSPSSHAESTDVEYVEWFNLVTASVSGLLEQTSLIRPSDPNAIERLSRLETEWAGLQRRIEGMRPPEILRTAHGLLLRSVQLGRMAGSQRMDASQLAGNASSGEAGAKMLLAQAQAAVATSAPPVAPRPAR